MRTVAFTIYNIRRFLFLKKSTGHEANYEKFYEFNENLENYE